MGEEGGSQEGWWLGGEEAQKGLKLPGGEQAMEVMGLLLLWRLSEVRSLENMASASGKLGGVAGVLLGVHICRAQNWGGGQLAHGEGFWGSPTRPWLRILPVPHTWLPPAHRSKGWGGSAKGVGAALGRGSRESGKDILDHPRC